MTKVYNKFLHKTFLYVAMEQLCNIFTNILGGYSVALPLRCDRRCQNVCYNVKYHFYKHFGGYVAAFLLCWDRRCQNVCKNVKFSATLEFSF